MIRKANETQENRHELAASLADAAYQVILAHGVQGSFIDLRLSLWKRFLAELRERETAPVKSISPFDWPRISTADAAW